MKANRLAWLAFLIFACACASAQIPKLEPGNKTPERTPLPTITFTVDWPGGAKPQYYSLRIESSGRAAYESVDDAQHSGEPYTVEFTLSRSVRDRIFAAARDLNYFNGKFDYTKHRIAFTGTKVLRYSDPDRAFQTSFNWSENTQLMELTRVLQAICSTVAYGQRLDYMRRFDRLGLNSELKTMEEAAQDHTIAELHTIAPVLRQIADNPNVMDLARQRARHLLRLADEESGAPASP